METIQKIKIRARSALRTRTIPIPFLQLASTQNIRATIWNSQMVSTNAIPSKSLGRCLHCLREAKKKSTSDFVVANRDGDPLSYTQFKRLWQYVVTRTAKPRIARKQVDGKYVKYMLYPELGEKARNNGHAGLRREESLALQWDCVFLDVPTPYISVRRAWRGSRRTEPEISTVLKTPASRRDIPIPKCLVECLREAKQSSHSAFVISNRKGGPLSEGEFVGVWYHVKSHTAGEKISYKYVNGEHIRYMTYPILGSHRKGFPNHVYSLDFHVTPHQLRHTYITNLLYMGVDPKTVQYLAGHKNSKTTMDIYAKIKYNKPQELLPVINAALRPVAMS